MQGVRHSVPGTHTPSCGSSTTEEASPSTVVSLERPTPTAMVQVDEGATTPAQPTAAPRRRRCRSGRMGNGSSSRTRQTALRSSFPAREARCCDHTGYRLPSTQVELCDYIHLNHWGHKGYKSNRENACYGLYVVINCGPGRYER